MDRVTEWWGNLSENWKLIVAIVVAVLLFSWPIKQGLFSGDGEIAPLDDRLCPRDVSLTAATHVILLDFSDPLPEAYGRRPLDLIDQVIKKEANQYDRIALYAFNPSSIVPKVIGNFCLPRTMRTMSRAERERAWGRGGRPIEPGEKLPGRLERHRSSFETLWEHERELNAELAEIIVIIADPNRQPEVRSRLIENIEEMVARERRAPAFQIKVHILSDMMENSRVYSLYGQPRNFPDYKEKRERAGAGDLPDMSDAEFFVDIIPSCGGTYTSKQKRELKKFWSRYFRAANSSVKFLPSKDVDLGHCAGDEPSPLSPDTRESREKQTGQEVLVDVPIRSDGTMRVRVEPGEDLGRFVGKRIISVRPGTYRIIGKRRRYEDSIHILTVHSNGKYEIEAAN